LVSILLEGVFIDRAYIPTLSWDGDVSTVKGLPTKKISHRFGEQGKQGAQGKQGRKNLTINSRSQN